MKIFWLDVETTGLSPERDVLLELAVAVADLERPFEIGPVSSWVFRFKEWRYVSPFVRDMHTKNGLLDECAKSTTTVAEVEEYLLTVVPVTDREDMPTLAGSSIHFDHAFLHVHMPRLAARFSHRHYDVSAVKLFCRSLGMSKPPKAEAHRATADVLESIEHAKVCAEWLSDRNWKAENARHWRRAGTSPEGPDAHCVTTADGGCVSDDSRDMHRLERREVE